MKTLGKNRTLLITLTVLAVLFVLAIHGMSTKDWVITLLRGLSVGAITFLVASGFSLIFGLMDVLNLAHGAFYMVGAYVGWTSSRLSHWWPPVSPCFRSSAGPSNALTCPPQHGVFCPGLP